MNTASKGTLENEFGTSNEDEVIKQILQKGDVQSTKVRHDITRPDSCEPYNRLSKFE
jgi:ribosome maturation protein Sdo1